MNHVDRVFSQGDASRLSGVPQDVLRDWRRRDFLGQLGEQTENGRWNYSLHEIVLLAIVRALECNGQPISRLIFMAHQLAFSVMNEFRPGGDYSPFARKVSAFWFGQDGGMMAPVSLRSLDDLDLIPGDSPQVIIVKADRLKAALPESIKAMLGEGD